MQMFITSSKINSSQMNTTAVKMVMSTTSTDWMRKIEQTCSVETEWEKKWLKIWRKRIVHIKKSRRKVT